MLAWVQGLSVFSGATSLSTVWPGTWSNLVLDRQPAVAELGRLFVLQAKGSRS